MFRRTKSESPTTATPAPKPEGKGRPTPSRKEAEAAARARAKAPRTRREQVQQQRKQRAESSRKVREAMRTGDERYFLSRDKGPVRRFIRDFVDSRFSFIELVLPVMIVTLVLSYSGSTRLAGIGNLILMGMFFLVIIDLITLRFRLRRELAARFPDEPTKGTTWYALSRSMQMKFMRMPKAQVKIGEPLPDRYR
ncbi:DUF3043 domain-containing protein [Nocardioides coralli]|uniref:DUF3043 domain-containing protein n=1 Tax=Nocardioides coralli TaxID=2872154 RepID=UPI001CA46BE9|nr:DUF3043 domain-containing protein [Nocardioides coralli]QZY28054.1 DUF3043 domain-containing protein [Nocardioides coralli]